TATAPRSVREPKEKELPDSLRIRSIWASLGTTQVADSIKPQESAFPHLPLGTVEYHAPTSSARSRTELSESKNHPRPLRRSRFHSVTLLLRLGSNPPSRVDRRARGGALRHLASHLRRSCDRARRTVRNVHTARFDAARI